MDNRVERFQVTLSISIQNNPGAVQTLANEIGLPISESGVSLMHRGGEGLGSPLLMLERTESLIREDLCEAFPDPGCSSVTEAPPSVYLPHAPYLPRPTWVSPPTEHVPLAVRQTRTGDWAGARRRPLKGGAADDSPRGTYTSLKGLAEQIQRTS